MIPAISVLLAGVSTVMPFTPVLVQSVSEPVTASASSAPEAPPPTASGDSDSTLTEIVVTAQKRSESIQRVPIAVTAVSGAALNANGLQLQTALPRVTPNLTFNSSSSFIAPYIRGVGSQFALPGLEQSVVTYFDDQYMPRSSSGLLSFNDIDHIEVLKGPQGTLYGRNATGGAIRIITRDPVDRLEIAAAATIGSYERRLFETLINVPVTPNLAIRVAGQHDENKGYVRNVLPGQPRENSRNQEFVRAKALWTPNDRLTVKLSADYAHKNDRDGIAFISLYKSAPEQTGVALGGASGRGFYETASDLPREVKQTLRTYGASLRLDYDVGGATLSSISGYRYNRSTGSADIDTTSLFLQHTVVPEELTRNYTQEVQLVSDNGGPLSYVAGLYYLHEYGREQFGVLGNVIGPATFLGTLGSVKVDSIAPYGQLSYQLTDTLQLTGGLRYTKERKKLLGNYGYIGPADGSGPIPGPIFVPPVACTVPATPNVPLCVSSARSVRFNRFTPKATLSYKPDTATMLYASYSRGFKSGGFNLPTPSTVDSVQPETLDAYEIGAKIERGRLRVNSAAFAYAYKNLQVAVTDIGTGGVRTLNAGKARIWGIETEVTLAPSSALEISFGGGYLHSEYRDYAGDAYRPCSAVPRDPSCIASGGVGLALLTNQDFNGNRLVNAPKWNGYGRAQYELPLADGSRIRVNALGSYQASLFYDSANLFKERSRFLLSGAVGWSSAERRYEVGLFVDNLTDRKYATNKTPQPTGGWYVPGQPRTIGVRVNVKFD